MRKKAYAKINIFLKLIQKRGDLHELKSRFILVDNLFDEIIFEKKSPGNEFLLEGDFDCELSKNTIFKAFKMLKNDFHDKMDSFFSHHKVKVIKNIPSFAGLGGGSSDAAAFLLLCNKVLGLKISKDELIKKALFIGSDVPFFVSEFQAANVSGVGEVIEAFDDDVPEIELIKTDFKCSTAEIFKAFNENFTPFCQKLLHLSTKELLQNYSNNALNDLLKPCLQVEPKLESYAQKGYFLSGSGSTFFKVRNG